MSAVDERARARARRSGRARARARLGRGGGARVYAGACDVLAHPEPVSAELVALRVPETGILEATTPRSPVLREVAERWRASRVDVAESTRVLHRVALDRVLPILGERLVDELTGRRRRRARHAAARRRKEARDDPKERQVPRRGARLRRRRPEPRARPERPAPARGDRGAAAADRRARRGRLPHCSPACTDCRSSGSTGRARASRASTRRRIADYDEPRRRVRLSASASKTRRALWVELPDVLADAIEATPPPREDRDPDAPTVPRLRC